MAFQAEGLSLEKLVRLCAEKGIPLKRVRRSGMKRLTGTVNISDVEKLQELCDSKGWRLSQTGYTGWRAVIGAMALHRGGLIAAVAMLALIFTAMQFIWQVKLEDAGAYEGDLRSYLLEIGIGTGSFKASVDLKQLAQDLEWRYPEVAWVHTSLRGSTLLIRLIEGVPTPDVAPYGALGDVVASKGGIIISVEPQAGTPCVKAGDIVAPGQVLIKGEEKRGEENNVVVKARGRVLARVWDQVRVQVSLTQEIREPTGNTTVTQEVATPWFVFSTEKEESFESADIVVESWPLGGAWWPVTLYRRTAVEVTVREELRDLDAAKAEAGLAALRLLREKIGLNDELVDKWVDYCMIEGGKVEACATGERQMDIAGFSPYE